MTTTLSPSIGHAPLYTQQGVGTSPGYDAIDDRRAANGGVQEGVVGASDFLVVQRAASANMSVDVGMPSGGLAYVQGDTVAGQGLYAVPVHSATINEAVTAANATNPRIDQVILEVQDNVHDASGGNLAQTRVLTGTATSGATLDNRNGAAALPGNALLLADILVGASVSSIDNSKIRDRRKWARGFEFSTMGDNTSDHTRSATTLASILSYQFRAELSGAPLIADFSGLAWNSTGADGVAVQWFIGAAALSAVKVSGSTPIPFLCRAVIVNPSAGSYLCAPQFEALIGGTANVSNSGGFVPAMFVREVIGQTARNGTT